ncbi:MULTISPECIES: MFS transporter [unclassified Psychrobacter]|uniref:MFS transporter n=2 Tax=Psychrobacter TaxID=497 RepID=UPI00086DADDE|nr:MFS transporter [Psychrobacter sp. B29-1]OEH66857.1 MAG: MFS transporter [Psychrobacter sp. B29-1]|tara:strand:- start:99358 stop:101046 length:1689 start_codon:yes stop_codon:yes gene_type:complete
MSNEYQFKPHEQPIMVGSPANPDHPARRKLFYLLIGIFVGLTASFQNGLLVANLTQIQGQLGLTPAEGGWISVSYNMTNACITVLLYKIRQQFGMSLFSKITLFFLLAATSLQWLISSHLLDTPNIGIEPYYLEIVARGLSGMVASGMTILGLFYCLQGMPTVKRTSGLILGFGLVQFGIPLSRIISPYLAIDGQLENLFLFQFGLALICFGLINILELPPGNTEKVFEKLDFLSFAFFASGLAALAVILVQGRILWWTTPWLVYPLMIAIVGIGVALWIETHRKNPMLQVRWMRSRNIIAFMITGAVMRILLSEQNVGAAGLLANLGYGNDQLVTFYAVIMAASVLALVISIFSTNPMDLRRPVIFAVALIALGSWMDVGVSINSAPYMFYISQFLIAFAAVYFMGPLVFEGFLRAIASGPAYIISFSVIFGISQTVGGLAGAAAIQAFTTIRTQVHYADMVSSLNLGDPTFSTQIAGTRSVLSNQTTDTAQANVAAMSQVLQGIQRQATVSAYSDLFFLMASFATFVTAILLINYFYNRYHKRNPLAKELAVIAKMRESK